MSKLLVVVGDTHINSLTGIAMPDTPLEGGGKYQPNKLQLWLYERFNDFITTVGKVQAETKPTATILVLTGDIVDINLKDPLDLITQNEAQVVRHGVDILEPLVSLADTRFFLKGTPVHVKQAGMLEELVAQRLGFWYDYPTKAFTRWLLHLQIDDVLFNIAHHGRAGRTAWTAMNPMMNFAANLLIESISAKRRAPDVVIRAHNHLFLDTGQALPIRVIQAPCWQFPNSYVFKQNIVRRPSIGGLLMEIDGDKCKLHEGTIYDIDTYEYAPIERI
jgi:hypothetical protein